MSGNDATPQTPPIDSPQQTKQSMLLDAFRRVEEHSPIWMLPRLISTQQLHKTLQAARQRARDSHAAQMKLTGIDVANTNDGGGIEVHGDTNVYTLNEAAKAGSGILRKALPLLLAAATGGGAAALLGPLALDWLHGKAAKPVVVATELATTNGNANGNGGAAVTVGGVAYQLGLEVKDSP